MHQAAIRRQDPEAVAPPPADGRLPDWAYAWTMASVVIYAFRDALTGSLRYYLDIVHLSFAWFIPDLMAIGCLVIFIGIVVRENRSAIGAMFIASFFAAMVIGAIFMNESRFAFITAVKCVVPLFVGMCLSGRSMAEHRGVRIFLFVVMVGSIVGLVLSPWIDYPWVGAEINNFGFTKIVGKLWWEGGGKIRYGGFAGDSTMAAFMCIFPYFLLYRHMPRWANVALWPIIYYAVDLTTSKTALLVLIVFIIFYGYFYMIRGEDARRRRIEQLATASFVAVVAPFILNFALGGLDLTAVSPSLFSLQDRINNTWVLPFSHIGELFPAGLVVGCGLGCYSYPMQYTELARYWLPVDNFYITSYLMFGVPFLILVLAQASSMSRVRSETKLVLVALINLYTITVQCYGPSFATVLIGYTFSDLILMRAPAWRRAGPERRRRDRMLSPSA